MTRTHARASLFALLAALPIAASGCRAGLPPAAAVGADELFTALGGRYLTVERTPRYAAARQRIGQMALIPSRVFDDSSVWTVRPAASVRILMGHGEVAGTSYRFHPVTAPVPLARLGDARHNVVLTRLGQGEYRWDTSVDYAVGHIGARTAGAMLGGFLASADGRRDRDATTDYRGSAPRTTAALGMLFSVDTLRPTPLRDGSTAVTLVVSMHTERLKRRWPELAGYLDRYAAPAKWKLAVRDPAGIAWITGEAGDRHMTLRLRTANGRLAPFAGVPRPMPDTLDVELDFSMKVGLFTVGFERLHMAMARVNTPREASWEFIAQREPQWRLPPLAERLIRSPLHRPFEGEGSRFRVGFRDEGDQTLLARHVRLPVEESAILRFIGRLGATAFGDISDTVEQQQAQFLRSVFLALRADMAELR